MTRFWTLHHLKWLKLYCHHRCFLLTFYCIKFTWNDKILHIFTAYIKIWMLKHSSLLLKKEQQTPNKFRNYRVWNEMGPIGKHKQLTVQERILTSQLDIMWQNSFTLFTKDDNNIINVLNNVKHFLHSETGSSNFK